MSPKLTRRQLLGAGASGALALATGCDASKRAASPSRPSIVFILADDLGYADLGVYGQTDYRTPNVDHLAAGGVRLTQGYANSAVCSASRFGLITGRYQYRLRGGLEEPIRGPSDTIGLPPEHPTLPSLLKKAGYRTALFGKWHLGYLPTFGPLKSGYEQYFGNYGGAIDYFTHKPDVGPDVKEDLYEGELPVHRVGYYTDLITEHAVRYIDERARAAEPFFLSLHYTAPHWPWEGPGDEDTSRALKDVSHHDGGSLAIYATMVTALDAAVGRVLSALEAHGLKDDTIVVFTSDNGGERFSKTWPFSGQKTELLEGGIRVPTVVRWPARLRPTVNEEQVAISMDWLPTLLAAAGAAPDPAYPPDGKDLLSVLEGKAPALERTLFWRYKANHQRAARSGNWKYLKMNDNEFLFDVVVDPRERANLQDRHPEVLARLQGEWERWNSQMLPITSDVHTHWVTPPAQADHYAPSSGD